MKRRTTMAMLTLVLGASAHANLFEYSFAGINAVILDADPNGTQNSQNITTSTLSVDSRTMGSQYTSISDVNVTLTLSGGYNGDLYGYLVHASGYTVLLNRVGTTSGDAYGYGDAGFSNITLDQSAATDIHLYGGGFVPTGSSWQPDGRNVDPAVVTSGSPRTTSLASFNGLDPHGSWTLYFADNSLGEQGTLMSWGLQINAVPEPVTWALMIFGGLAGGIQVGRRWFVSRKSPQGSDATVLSDA